jgi:hypothetical protein
MPRVMALMEAIAGFTYLIAGFDNSGLVVRMRALLDDCYSSRHENFANLSTLGWREPEPET